MKRKKNILRFNLFKKKYDTKISYSMKYRLSIISQNSETRYSQKNFKILLLYTCSMVGENYHRILARKGKKLQLIIISFHGM